MIASPIGVAPLALSVGGLKFSAVVMVFSTLGGPKVKIAVSTRFIAIESDDNSSL